MRPPDGSGHKGTRKKAHLLESGSSIDTEHQDKEYCF
jgi:hypothetical protein